MVTRGQIGCYKRNNRHFGFIRAYEEAKSRANFLLELVRHFPQPLWVYSLHLGDQYTVTVDLLFFSQEIRNLILTQLGAQPLYFSL